MSNIVFWYAPGACSLAPHILLIEAGVDYDPIETTVTASGADFPEGFQTINPKLRVPVLSLDGHVITEVPAIATAVASLNPGRALLGRTTIETVRVYEWMAWISGSLHGHGFGTLWRPQRYSDDADAFPGIMQKAAATVRDYFAFAENKIVGPYALGDAFTAVDAYLYVFYRWGNMIGLDLASDFPRFAALGERLVTRASVIEATEREGVDIHGRIAPEEAA